MKSKRNGWAQTNKTINISLNPKGYAKNKKAVQPHPKQFQSI